MNKAPLLSFWAFTLLWTVVIPASAAFSSSASKEAMPSYQQVSPADSVSGDTTEVFISGSSFTAMPLDTLLPDSLIREAAQPETIQSSLPSYRIEEIVVTAGRLVTRVGRLPARTLVVDKPEIENSAERTPIDVLQEKEGVSAGSYGSFGALQLISMRGSRFGRVPTLLDGIPINNTQNGAADFNAVPLSLLEKMEVIRGPLGLLHGGNGVVGVVNLVTAEPRAGEKALSVIGLSSGSLAYRKRNASFLNRYGRVGTFFGIEEAGSDGVGAYRSFESRDYFGKLSFDLGKTREVALFLSSYSGKLKTVRSEKQETDVSRFHLTGSAPLGSRARLEVKAFHSEEGTDFEDPYVKTASDLEKYGALFDVFLLNTVFGDAGCGGGVTRNLLSCRDESFFVPEVQSWQPKTWEGFLFAQNELELTSSLRMFASLRADHHSTYGTELSPCFSLSHQRAESKFWVSIGRGFNPPTLNDLFWPTQTTVSEGWSYVTAGNDQLSAESSWMVEVGSDFALIDAALRGGVCGFLSRTKDYVTWGSSVSPSPPTIKFAPVNSEQVQARGIEAGVDFFSEEQPFAGVNVTIQRVEDKDNHVLAYMPEVQGNVWFSRGTEVLPDVNLSVWVNGTLVGSQVEPMGSRQGSFFLLEERVTLSLYGFTAYARLRNATDENYPSRFFKSFTTGDNPKPLYYPMPGRTYDVGVMVKLLN